jgi:hypothetical protein
LMSSTSTGRSSTSSTLDGPEGRVGDPALA